MKYFLIFLILISTKILFGQNFPLTGSEWHFKENYAFNPNTGTIIMKHVGDTIFNNIHCKVIDKDKISCDQRFRGFQYLFERNDSVFHFNSFTNDFELIIRFDAIENESWIIKKFNATEFVDSMICMVDSLSTITKNNIPFKVQHVTMIGYQNGMLNTLDKMNSKIIESIGFESALFPKVFTYVCDDNFVKELNCFQSDSTGLIKFVESECISTPTLFQDRSSSHFKIYPNPTQDYLFIEELKDLKIEEVRLYNLWGKLLIKTTNSHLDLTDLQSDIFILSIKTKNSRFNLRVVKL